MVRHCKRTCCQPWEPSVVQNVLPRDETPTSWLSVFGQERPRLVHGNRRGDFPKIQTALSRLEKTKNSSWKKGGGDHLYRDYQRRRVRYFGSTQIVKVISFLDEEITSCRNELDATSLRSEQGEYLQHRLTRLKLLKTRLTLKPWKIQSAASITLDTSTMLTMNIPTTTMTSQVLYSGYYGEVLYLM